MSLFGQSTHALNEELSATFGGRLSLVSANARGSISNTPTANNTDLQFLPIATLAWRPSPDHNFHIAYREGFRAGGSAVDFEGVFDQIEASSGTMDASATLIQNIEFSPVQIEPDFIRTTEIGWRFGYSDQSPLSGGISAYHSLWRNVQADVFQIDTFPQTANIGDGRSYGLSAQISWNPIVGTQISGDFFWNESTLEASSLLPLPNQERRLPNIPDVGGALSGSWTGSVGRDWDMSIWGSVRYIGSSQIGIDFPFARKQGDYVDGSLELGFSNEDISLSLRVSNPFNTRGNTFSYGNPWLIGVSDIATPLRPRSVRIGAVVAF